MMLAAIKVDVNDVTPPPQQKKHLHPTPAKNLWQNNNNLAAHCGGFLHFKE